MRPAIARDLAAQAHMAEGILQGALESARESETDHSGAFEAGFSRRTWREPSRCARRGRRPATSSGPSGTRSRSRDGARQCQCPDARTGRENRWPQSPEADGSGTPYRRSLFSAESLPMNILLIGSGGREHALAWSFSASPLCDRLFIAPGNPGTAQHGTNVVARRRRPPARHRFLPARWRSASSWSGRRRPWSPGSSTI